MCAALLVHTLLAAVRSLLHTCGANSEQHSGAVHAGICVEGAAVETAILLRHTCELQTHIQVVGAEQPTHLPAWRGRLGPLATPYQTPGFSVIHFLHSDAVNCVVAPVFAADGHVVVLSGLQRAVGPDCMCGGAAWLLTAAAVVIFFWGHVWQTQEISPHSDTSQKFHTLLLIFGSNQGPLYFSKRDVFPIHSVFFLFLL